MLAAQQTLTSVNYRGSAQIESRRNSDAIRAFASPKPWPFSLHLGFMTLGGHKPADLELNEAQRLLGVGVLFTISLQCAMPGMLPELKRKLV